MEPTRHRTICGFSPTWFVHLTAAVTGRRQPIRFNSLVNWRLPNGVIMNVTTKLEQLKEAEAIYEQASTAESLARSEATSALNKLNAAQKAFDDECEKLRDKAKGGDWKSRNNRVLVKAS